jgi:hypothetical protein
VRGDLGREPFEVSLGLRLGEIFMAILLALGMLSLFLSAGPPISRSPQTGGRPISGFP